MKICVYGLWHLGCVSAACLAQAGHQVIGLDQDEAVVEKLNQGVAPIMEPGLKELIQQGLVSTTLSFSTDMAAALKDTPVVWVTFDTPVDESDQADVEFVLRRIERLFPYLEEHSLVLISSQLPVGSVRETRNTFMQRFPGKQAHFAYSPENLRLGQAIQSFTHPDRVVAGYEDEAARRLIGEVFEPFNPKMEWMSIESAEMTKHALNAFLATSVAFINEVAALCEQTGADAKDVERGLKSDSRIGERAYLSPGGAFAGGTLARDIRFLSDLGRRLEFPTPLVDGVRQSNEAHRMWAVRRLTQLTDTLIQKKIAVWGLAYKVGTNTLRRSGAVDMCRELAAQGALIYAYDPAIQQLPDSYAQFITLCATPQEALQDADALIVYTGWPEFKLIDPEVLATRMKTALALDANRFLADSLQTADAIRYITVGKGVEEF